jgi:hypothetical protein
MSSKDELELPATVYDTKNKPLAQVSLNGHNIAAGGLFGRSGSMRSFRLVTGDLWDYWNNQATLTLRDNDGRESLIRVYALPAEEDSFGFIEFV